MENSNLLKKRTFVESNNDAQNILELDQHKSKKIHLDESKIQDITLTNSPIKAELNKDSKLDSSNDVEPITNVKQKNSPRGLPKLIYDYGFKKPLPKSPKSDINISSIKPEQQGISTKSPNKKPLLEIPHDVQKQFMKSLLLSMQKNIKEPKKQESIGYNHQSSNTQTLSYAQEQKHYHHPSSSLNSCETFTEVSMNNINKANFNQNHNLISSIDGVFNQNMSKFIAKDPFSTHIKQNKNINIEFRPVKFINIENIEKSKFIINIQSTENIWIGNQLILWNIVPYFQCV